MSVAAWILDQLSKSDLTQESFFPHNPENFESYQFPDTEKQKLLTNDFQEWSDFLSSYNPPKAVLKNLERLKKPGAAVVCTGQQPGILGGPFYSISKAVSAIHWAKKLEKLHGKPVIPIFWVASDDHDFKEVASTHLLDEDYKPYSVSVAENINLRGHSVSEYNFSSEEIDALIQQISSLPVSSTPQDVESFVRKIFTKPTSYHKQVSFETQFIQLMLELLGPLGLVPVIPSLKFLRRNTFELFKKDLESAPNTSEFLVSEGQRLAKEVSKHSKSIEKDFLGIHRKGTELNFFWHRKEGRCRIEKQNEEFVVIEPNNSNVVDQLPEKELLSQLEKDFLNLSPNAALRPLVQDSALPNLITIGGFGELAYHAQIAGLYQRYGIQRPLLVPRAQFRLIPPRVERFLDQVQFSADDIKLEDFDLLTEKLMLQYDPTQTLGEVRNSFQDMDNQIENLIQFLQKQEDPKLMELTEKLKGILEKGEGKVEKRIRDRFADQHESAGTRWQTVWDVIWPEKMPQERTLSVISPLLALNGSKAIEYLAEATDGTQYKSIQTINLRELAPEN